jgi:hypothetical protein
VAHLHAKHDPRHVGAADAEARQGVRGERRGEQLRVAGAQVEDAKEEEERRGDAERMLDVRRQARKRVCQRVGDDEQREELRGAGRVSGRPG